ncbi:MAG: SWIM zinc finger family protein [Planctomycetaceae bacterium]
MDLCARAQVLPCSQTVVHQPAGPAADTGLWRVGWPATCSCPGGIPCRHSWYKAVRTAGLCGITTIVARTGIR